MLMKENNVLQSLLSAPISCTLTLKELLKIQIYLWYEVVEFLVTRRTHTHTKTMSHRASESVNSRHSSFRDTLSIKKLGKTNEHIKGHTTLTVKYGDIESMAMNLGYFGHGL